MSFFDNIEDLSQYLLWYSWCLGLLLVVENVAKFYEIYLETQSWIAQLDFFEEPDRAAENLTEQIEFTLASSSIVHKDIQEQPLIITTNQLLTLENDSILENELNVERENNRRILQDNQDKQTEILRLRYMNETLTKKLEEVQMELNDANEKNEELYNLVDQQGDLIQDLNTRLLAGTGRYLEENAENLRPVDELPDTEEGVIVVIVFYFRY